MKTKKKESNESKIEFPIYFIWRLPLQSKDVKDKLIEIFRLFIA